MLLFILIIPFIVLISSSADRFGPFAFIGRGIISVGLIYIFLQADFWMGILLPIAILSPIVYIIKRLTRGKKIEVNANGPYEVTKKKFKMPHIFKGTPLEVEYLNTDGAWIGKNNIVWKVE